MTADHHMSDEQAEFLRLVGTVCVSANLAKLAVGVNTASGQRVTGVPGHLSYASDEEEQVDDTGFARTFRIDGAVVNLDDIVEFRLRAPDSDESRTARRSPMTSFFKRTRPPIGVPGHSLIDYGFVAFEVTGPSLIGLGARARRIAIGWGITQGVLNALTDQPYALRRLIGFKMHGRLESVAVPGLAAAIHLTGVTDEDRATPYFGALVGALGAVYALTDWNASPRR